MSREPRNGNNHGRKDMLDFWMMTEISEGICSTLVKYTSSNGVAKPKVGVIYPTILPKNCFQNRLPIQIDAYHLRY